MARQSMVQMVNAIRALNPADKKTVFDLFTALREAIAPTAGLLFGSAAGYDAPSIAIGGSATTNVTVTGAALGDLVTAVSLSVSAAGLTVTGYVSAANTVTVVLANNTAGAVDLAAATVRATVMPFALAADGKRSNFAA